MIDVELVARKMVLITEDLRQLEALARKPVSEYTASPTDEVLAERYLERVIGRMIDINDHLLTEAGAAPPKDCFDSFVALGRAGVLPADFATRTAACAGLRNRIVHLYDAIDPARVHEALQAALRDVPQYLRRVGAHLGI